MRNGGRRGFSTGYRLLTTDSERVEQLLVDSVEAAVGHDGDHVAFAKDGREVCDDCVRAVEAEGGASPRGYFADERVGVEELAVGAAALARKHRGDDDGVGGAEGCGVLALEDCEARGGRARLEDGDDSPARVLVAQRSQRLADGGRVVREVVNDRDAALAPAHLHAPLDALERGERVLDLRARDAPRFGGDDDREAVAHVEVADERHLELTPLRAVAEDPEARHLARSVINVARLPARVVARAEGFKLRVKPVAHLPDDLPAGCAGP